MQVIGNWIEREFDWIESNSWLFERGLIRKQPQVCMKLKQRQVKLSQIKLLRQLEIVATQRTLSPPLRGVPN